jgi:hypothetical protein
MVELVSKRMMPKRKKKQRTKKEPSTVDTGSGMDISATRVKKNGLKLLRHLSISMFKFFKILRTLFFLRDSKE